MSKKKKRRRMTGFERWLAHLDSIGLYAFAATFVLLLLYGASQQTLFLFIGFSTLAVTFLSKMLYLSIGSYCEIRGESSRDRGVRFERMLTFLVTTTLLSVVLVFGIALLIAALVVAIRRVVGS